MIDNNKIEEIKNSIDIVDLISEYLALKKSGKNYKALCPFHNEKTPSFIVSPEKQIFHCFGCGIGGNIFTFIQKQENLSFIESVHFLAKRAGIEIHSYEDKIKISEKQKIIEINKVALSFFRENLKKSERANEYIKNRGITDDIIEDFKLGYAPKGNLLCQFLKSKNFNDEIIIKAGLGVKKNMSLSDVFFDRLIFPIFNIYDMPVAFGARTLDDNIMPKYINTKETEAYIKGRILFNLNNAKKFCSEYILVVEGYMDTIALYKNNFKNVVATSGTALTEEQARIIKRYTNKVYLLYDSDDAGIAGALRGGYNLFLEGIEVFVIILNEAKDPDEFIKKFGSEKLFQLIKEAKPYFDFKLDLLKKKGNIKNSYYKQKILEDIIDLIIKVDNLVLKEDLIRKVSYEFDISEAIIRNFIEKKEKNIIEGDIKQNNIFIYKGIELAEKFLIFLVLTSLDTEEENLILKHFIEKRKQLEITYTDFKNKIYAQILERIEKFYLENEKEILNKIQISFIENEEINKSISEILTMEKMNVNLENKLNIIDDCFIKIIKVKYKNESQDLQNKIKEAEKENDVIKLDAYIRKKQEIQKKIKILNGGKNLG